MDGERRPGGMRHRAVVLAIALAVACPACSGDGAARGADPATTGDPSTADPGPGTRPTPRDARPPLSTVPVPVDPPNGPGLTTMVTDLAELDLVVLRRAQDAADRDDVRRIGADRYVGNGLVAFTEFATAMLDGVDLPDDAPPVTDVVLVASGPGCVVATHVVGTQPPVTERLVATGTAGDPTWRVERTLTADQLDPDRACPTG